MKQRRATAWRVTGKAFVNRESRSQSRGAFHTLLFTIDYGRKRRTRGVKTAAVRVEQEDRRDRFDAVSRVRSLSTVHATTPFPNEPRREEALEKPKRRDGSFAPDQRRRDSTE